MARLMTVSTLAGLSILGGAIGAHLGRSAIGEINPSYFRGGETRFHADLVPNRAPDWAQAPAPQYLDASLVQGLGGGCVRCLDYPEEYRPVPDAAAEGFSSEDTAALDHQVADRFVASQPSAEGGGRIEPYIHYAITAEAKNREAETQVAQAGEAVEAGTNHDAGAGAP